MAVALPLLTEKAAEWRSPLRAVDLLLLDPGGRGMNNLIGARAITGRDLLGQAVGTQLPKMAVVPGLIAVCGSGKGKTGRPSMRTWSG